MKTPNSLTTRLIVLALLVAFGPLKATAAFACDMMETVVLEECCCDDAGTSRLSSNDNQDCDDEMTGTAPTPCCEQLTTVSVDAEDIKATPAQKAGSKTAGSYFDFDPPDMALALPAGVMLPAVSPGKVEVVFAGANLHDGSTLWLTTRRLRI